MINQELRTYIETQLARGVERSSIEKVLRDTGWKEEDIQNAFTAVLPPKSSPVSASAYIQPGVVNVMQGIEKDSSPKGRSLLISSLLITLLLVIGGFLYIFYFLIPSPQSALTKMISAIGNVNTLEYKVQASTQGATCTDVRSSFSEEGEVMSVCNVKKPFSNRTTISGVADISSFSNPTHQLTLKSENTLENQDGLSEKAMIQVDLISLQKSLYVKVSNLIFPLASFFDTTTFVSKWISVDIAGLQQQFLGTDPSLNTELISQDKVERIKEMFLNANMLSVVDATEDVFEGNGVYKYTFEINQEQQKELLVDLYSILYEDINSEMSEEDIEAVSQSVKSVGVIEGELWIGKKDFLPYKVVLNPDVVMYNGVYELTSANMVFEFKNYNVPISVQAPASTISFEEVMAKLFAPTTEVAATTSVKVIPKR
jgi:hypothetical protein